MTDTATRQPLDIAAIELLGVIHLYGNPLDMTGRFDSKTKTLARALIASGHLSGPMSRVMVTKAGDAALKSARGG